FESDWGRHSKIPVRQLPRQVFLFSKAENKFEIFVHKVIASQSFRQTILASIKNILARIQDD
ncbi:hypothetical protein, partial [Sutterella wadsworthensis]|uniref:hypothetical protein n=1 Tax=Sutterella wadsworthensis TaxID=40545 RepID=UPI003AF9CEB7